MDYVNSTCLFWAGILRIWGLDLITMSESWEEKKKEKKVME